MLAFAELTEIDNHGFPRGKLILNLNAVIYAREVKLSNMKKACRLVTTELAADEIMAAGLGASASYSENVLVDWDLAQFSEFLKSFNIPLSNIRKAPSA